MVNVMLIAISVSPIWRKPAETGAVPKFAERGGVADQPQHCPCAAADPPRTAALRNFRFGSGRKRLFAWGFRRLGTNGDLQSRGFLPVTCGKQDGLACRQQSHIRVVFQFQNFILVGIWRGFLFSGTAPAMTNSLFHNGFIRRVENFSGLASQLQKPFRPVAFLFTLV